MSNRNTRTVRALMLVFASMMLATMACYSGQIPGVLELTPFYTETPLPVPEESRFELGALAFAPQEENRAFFNLTVYPEPLQDNLVNSKEMCQPDSTAKVLYVGVADDGTHYYLVDCEGSVGWTSGDRLAGPLTLEQYSLGITVAAAGETQIEVFDPITFMPPVFSQPCQPGSITRVKEVTASDTIGDGMQEIFYRIECPRGSDVLVAQESLFGPLELNVGEKALAVSADASTTGEYQLASEPSPLTDDNAVEGTCPAGSEMEAQEVRYINGDAYYRVTCGDIEGWTTQSRFVGPLRFAAGESVMTYVEPIFVFADLLPQEDSGQVVDEEAAVEEPVEVEVAEDGGTEQRDVVAYQAPIIVLSAIGTEDFDVVGQCLSNQVAKIIEVNRDYYEDLNEVYYRINCSECTETTVNEDGETVCANEVEHEGWVSQSNLEGPIPFVPGDRTVYAEKSGAIAEDEDGTLYAQLPIDLEAAFSIGRYTTYAGRCPVEDGVEIVDVALEKSRTGTSFNFYFQVECTGQSATYTTETDSSGTTRPVVSFDTESNEVIRGWVSASELQSIER